MHDFPPPPFFDENLPRLVDESPPFPFFPSFPLMLKELKEQRHSPQKTLASPLLAFEISNIFTFPGVFSPPSFCSMLLPLRPVPPRCAGFTWGRILLLPRDTLALLSPPLTDRTTPFFNTSIFPLFFSLKGPQCLSCPGNERCHLPFLFFSSTSRVRRIPRWPFPFLLDDKSAMPPPFPGDLHKKTIMSFNQTKTPPPPLLPRSIERLSFLSFPS